MSAVVALLLMGAAPALTADAAMRNDRMIDPEIQSVVRAGRARVIVTLRVGQTDDAHRAEAIVRAQDAVLSRLPASHASLARRYSFVPMLALEIDATALQALETMTDVVASVRLDRTAVPQ